MAFDITTYILCKKYVNKALTEAGAAIGDNSISQQVQANKEALEKLNSGSGVENSVDYKVLAAINALKNDVSTDFDTLKEIETALKDIDKITQSDINSLFDEEYRDDDNNLIFISNQAKYDDDEI